MDLLLLAIGLVVGAALGALVVALRTRGSDPRLTVARHENDLLRVRTEAATERADLQAELASHEATIGALRRQLERYRRWLETRDGYPAVWRRAAEDSEFVFWLTPDELEALGNELVDLLLPRFRVRLTDPAARPADALPVEMLVLGYPIEAPEADA